MTPQDILRRFEAAQAVAVEAGRLARRYFLGQDAIEIEKKSSQDWCTTADREVEKLIIDGLRDRFPEDGFFGEEGGGADHDSLWVIDPIDGTSNFIRGLNEWCISIAFVAKGSLEIGIVHDPNADDFFAARRGGGATLNGKPIQVSRREDIREAMVGVGFSYRTAVKSHTALLGRLLDAECEYRRSGSGALAMAHVAQGRLDGYAELHINSWDVLGGIALVREAGGWTNDFLSGDWLTKGNPILAASPGIREALVEISEIAAPPTH